MWTPLAVVLLLVATAQGAAVAVLALVVRDLARELARRPAVTPARPILLEEEPPPSSRPVPTTRRMGFVPLADPSRKPVTRDGLL